MSLSGEICLLCDAERLVIPGWTTGLPSPIHSVCYRLSEAQNRIAAKLFSIAAIEA
jgi:hypothetical protein